MPRIHLQWNIVDLSYAFDGSKGQHWDQTDRKAAAQSESVLQRTTSADVALSEADVTGLCRSLDRPRRTMRQDTAGYATDGGNDY